MLDNLILFPPTRQADVPARPVLAREGRDMTLGQVIEAIGYAGFSERVARAHLGELVDRHGFPPPRSPRLLSGVRQQGSAAIWTRSLWDRDAVERWLHDDLPPAMAAAQAANDRTVTRARLGARTALIAGGSR